MKGVIYARYSSDNQREESIEGQIRENTAYAEKNGITIVGHYIDRALSAKTDNRPEFQRMIRDSAKKNFDVVIVWKLDRFSRNRYDSAKYKAMLKKNNVRVVSATESISEGAEGIILESVLEGMAEYYSADLAEKVKRGMTENALKCRFNGSAIPFGYSVDEEKHYQLNPVTAPVVLEIFQKYADGMSIKDITDELNARGLKTAKGADFNKNSMRHMFKNRIYIGEYKYSDIVIPNGIPAIVPLELFDRVNERMQKNKHASAKNKATEPYILTTKLFCGDCKTKDLGKQLKPLGMMVVLENLWDKIVRNRERGIRTRIYIDEIYLLFRNEESANFLFELYKRARKWGGIPTGITQNVEDLLKSDTARSMLSNSEFILMLNQAASDRDKLAHLLKIPENMMNFVTGAPAGSGLIYCGLNGSLPFKDDFPTDTKLYKLMTTKFGE